MRKLAKQVIQRVFALRIPANPLHRVLAWEFQMRRFAFYEALRIFYYQPMFEALCKKVGSGMRMELTPDSVLPAIGNVDLELGERVRMSARTTFSGARNSPSKPRITVGDDTYIGHRVTLRAGTELVIGKHVLIASNVLISGDPGHPMDAIERRTQPAPASSLTRIEVGDDAWLAYNVTVVGQVKIGKGAVVAANSVVTKDVPAYALVAGNPARVVKMLDGSSVPEAKPKTEVLELPRSVSVPNTLKVGVDRNAARQALKQHYVELFSAQGQSEAEVEAAVERAFRDLDTLDTKAKAKVSEQSAAQPDLQPRP